MTHVHIMFDKDYRYRPRWTKNGFSFGILFY